LLEIKFFGRGGQGVVLASQILAKAFFKMGFYPQCFSLFGGERRGAPVESFLRVDRERIKLRCGIRNPHHLIIMSLDLISPELLSGVKEGGLVLLNADSLPELLEDYKESLILALIDAQKISEQIGLGRVINTAILGAYCKINGDLELGFLEEAVKETISYKLEENLKALRLAYERVRLYPRKGHVCA